MEPVRILVADDHALFRAGLRALLHEVGGFQVVAEANDGLEALTILKTMRPDLALLDLMMPGLNGLETTARLVREFPTIPVIILSMNSGEEFVLPAVRAGASGYILKNAAPKELIRALRDVSRGTPYFTAAASRHIAGSVHQRAFEKADPWTRLTSRQREVLQLVAEGLSTKEIAARLQIASKTVETYRSQLMASLQIRDIAGLTRYAIRIGLVSV